MPLIAFDPITENEKVERVVVVPEKVSTPDEPGSSAKDLKQAKRNDEMRFKCNDCAYTTKYKHCLKQHQKVHKTAKPFKCDRCGFASKHEANVRRHQRIHADQKMLGHAHKSNDAIFKCTYCDQQFTKWHGLKSHLTLSHKNNQRLLNCAHCMRRFIEKSKKDRHEIQCQNRYFECYICKTYVTRKVTGMQVHMRTYTGAKPFECAICNKHFRQKSALISDKIIITI